MRKQLTESQEKAILAIQGIKASYKLQSTLDELIPLVQYEGITEGDTAFFIRVIKDHRNQIINPEMHLMNLQNAKEEEQTKLPIGMSSVYYMIFKRSEKKPVEIPISDIIAKANRFFGVDILKRTRKKEVILAKHMAIKWMRTAKHKCTVIAKELGMDHSSVVHANQSLTHRVGNEPEIYNVWKDFLGC